MNIKITFAYLHLLELGQFRCCSSWLDEQTSNILLTITCGPAVECETENSPASSVEVIDLWILGRGTTFCLMCTLCNKSISRSI